MILKHQLKHVKVKIKLLLTLIADMKAGKVGAVIMSGVNPLYTLPNASDFAEGLKKLNYLLLSL